MSRTARPTTAALAFAALGIVFGDIGTSPLYAFRTCFELAGDLQVTEASVLGLLSLIVWALVLVISVKYVTLMLRADNRGEGGVLALLTLVLGGRSRLPRGLVVLLAMAGAALFFADGAITPAISVLSAVEGLAIADPGFERAILPVSLLILAWLFVSQRHGTGRLARLFAPVTLAWFVVLATLGLASIAERPDVLAALDPRWAVSFFASHGGLSMLVLSAVFLTVTGGEALYADMGHFGRPAIRLAWFSVALPALLLNYFGQGARVLLDPSAIENPFYLMAPGWALYPLVLLATAATVIASQAVISGVFSLTRQALQLGFLPRLRIIHSSEHTVGQVYVPAANWLLMAATTALVLAFRSSGNLAGAYGIAISMAMAIDGLLLVALLLRGEGAPARVMLVAALVILPLDLLFVTSNSLRIPQGGWVPLAMAGALLLMMATWKDGRIMLLERASRRQMPVREFCQALANPAVQRLPGTAVYLGASTSGIPRPLQRSLEFDNAVHERVVMMSFVTGDEPRVPRSQRVAVTQVGPGLVRILARYGFMETPSVESLLADVQAAGVEIQAEKSVFVVGRSNVVVTHASGMARWRKRLFSLMVRNAQSAGQHYSVPRHRVVESGELIEI